MPDWNELFTDEKNIERIPSSEILRFAHILENIFNERPLRVWDLCSGAGRHTIALAQAGCQVYASDIAPNGLKITQRWLDELELHADLKLSDMTICPWPENDFHGVISWNALQHNRLNNIKTTINEVHKHLVPGGLFMLTLKSTKADSYGTGHEIEPDTFVQNDDKESGVPHHFFDETAIKDLFQDWEFISFAEQIMHYVHRGENFREHNPFSYTHWCILAKKI